MTPESLVEVVSPAMAAPCYPSSSLWNSHSQNACGEGSYGEGSWTLEENKRFENALAVIDVKSPDPWEKVAAFVPGKTPAQVFGHYRHLVDDVRDIETGRIQYPGYASPSFTSDQESDSGLDASRQNSGVGEKRPRPSEHHERKKGAAWTQKEHMRFLVGLSKCGKGDWRNISRNFVHTRTPTQVASHAQKYFLRQKSGSKEKRRSSIHDITTASIQDVINGYSTDELSRSQVAILSTNLPQSSSHFHLLFDPNQPTEAAAAAAAAGVFNATPVHEKQFIVQQHPGITTPVHEKQFIVQQHPGITPYVWDENLQAQGMEISVVLHDSFVDDGNSALFQRQSGQLQFDGSNIIEC